MKLKSFSAKLLSIMLSVSMMCGIFLAIPTLAEPTPDTSLGFSMGTIGNDEVLERKDVNYIKDAQYRIYPWQSGHQYGWLYSNEATNVARMRDGDTANTDFGAGTEGKGPAGGAAGIRSYKATMGFRIIFDFGSVKQLSSVLIGWSEAAPVTEYNVYAAETLARFEFGLICKTDNKIISVKDETGNTCNRLLTLDSPMNVRYICFEITGSSGQLYDGSDFLGFVLTELAAYGLVSGTEMSDETVAGMSGNNILNTAVLDTDAHLLYSGKDEKYPRDTAQLIDGKVENEGYKGDEDADGLLFEPSAAAKDSPLRFTYKLDDAYYVERFLVSVGELAPGAYKIYLSDSKSALYNTEPVSEYKKGTKKIHNRLEVLEVGRRCTYIGFEFSDIPETDSGAALCLLELGAYGYVMPKEYTDNDSLEENYIENNYSGAIKEISCIELINCEYDSKKLPLLSDGKTDGALRVAIKDGEKAQLTVELGAMYFVDSVLVALTEKSLPAGYSIYLSEDREKLYTEDCLYVIKTYNSGDKTPALYSFDEPHYIKYIGIQFDEGATDSNGDFAELSELNIYGMKVGDAYTVRTNVSDDTLNEEFVTENHSRNLLTEGIISLVASTISGDGYYLAYGEGGTYPRSLNMLCDGQVALDGFTHKEPGDTLNFRQYTSGPGTTKLRFKLDLGYFDCSIQSIMLYGLKGNEIGRYNIYISDDKNTIFDRKNWVAFYDNTDCSAAQEIVFNEKLSGHFVGVEITVKNLNPAEAAKAYNEQNVYLKEIAVYGERDESQIPKPAYEYTVYEDIVDQEYVSANHKYNLIRYARSTNTYDDGTDYKIKSFTGKVTDGTVYDGSTHYTGENVEEVFTPFRATYSLGQTVTIDKVLFASFYHNSIDFSTQIYEIYISETLEDLYEPENLAVYQNNYGKWRAGQSATHTGTNQVFEFTGNKPVGRYVGFRIILPTAGQDMRIRIEQLGVYAEGVTPVDPVYIKSVTDNSTGVQVALKKLEYEDEFNRYASLSLVPYTPSSEIAEKAASSYLDFKGIGYKIILKDAQGKILTEEDLDGRELEISIPYTQSDNAGRLYVCEADGTELKNNTILVEKDRVIFTTKSLNPIAFFEDTFGHGFAASQLLKWDPVYELSLRASQNNSEDNYDDYDDYDYSLDTDTNVDTETSDLPDDTEETTPKKVKKIVTKRVVKNNASIFTSPWFWIIVAAVVLAAVGTTVLIIIKRKKRNINV
ncbi:MAG: hypothetical protein ACI4F7_08010 [Acutalibacteraceae bacterium]